MPSDGRNARAPGSCWSKPAGLCLRCSPYVDGGLGLAVLEATSGMNLPLKVGPILSMADVAVVTKIDLVSQVEREVFRARVQEVAPGVRIREVNALYGIGIDPLVEYVRGAADVGDRLVIRGNPPSERARSAWERRRSGGNPTSVLCSRSKTRPSIEANEKWASTWTTQPRHPSTRE